MIFSQDRSSTPAIDNVNKVLNEELKGFFVTDQNEIDAKMIELDGSDNKDNLGKQISGHLYRGRPRRR